MGNIREILAYNLVRLRSKKTMADLAELAGIPYRTYQDIEAGIRWPRVENLEAIAKALGVEPSALFSPPAENPTHDQVLAIVAEALQSRRETPTLAPPTGDLARVAAALESEAGHMLIMDVVKEVERSQRKKASKPSSESA